MGSANAGTAPWWHNTAIYQVYVRSFQDSNGDGIGDLAGVTQRLPYLQALGVRALWLTPFYPSPNLDFGYDVADYCSVAPEYGTLADFDRLVARAQACGLRVLVDLVLNHTSSQHPWFAESRASHHNPRRSWYVWRDGAPGGGPPNNWQSVFGGPAWTRCALTDQWYYHAFLPEQPDLNWHHPSVQQAMWQVVHFWLRRGVSGFRLDATAFLFEDPSYSDDPQPEAARANPLRPHNSGRPENHTVLRALRQVLAAYPGDPVLLGESATDTLAELVAAYGAADDEIPLPMNFMYGRHWQRDAPGFKRLTDEAQAALQGCMPVFFFSNHDHPRQHSAFGVGPSRVDPLGDHDDAIARLTAALTLVQRGTALIYYGEEVGMRDLPDDEWAAAPTGPQRPRADPRDRARTPMQWQAGALAGFTTGKPWLPLPRQIGHHHVAAQQADAASLWHWYRSLLALKHEHPALCSGAHVPLHSGCDEVLAFGRRTAQGVGAVVVLNFSNRPQRLALQGWPGGLGTPGVTLLASPGPPQGDLLAAYGAWLFEVRAPAD